jgi:hypothetical protein
MACKKRKFYEKTPQFPRFRARSFFLIFVTFVLDFVDIEGSKRNIFKQEQVRRGHISNSYKGEGFSEKFTESTRTHERP